MVVSAVWTAILNKYVIFGALAIFFFVAGGFNFVSANPTILIFGGLIFMLMMMGD